MSAINLWSLDYHVHRMCSDGQPGYNGTTRFTNPAPAPHVDVNKKFGAAGDTYLMGAACFGRMDWVTAILSRTDVGDINYANKVIRAVCI
jgi:hypothetical protein